MRIAYDEEADSVFLHLLEEENVSVANTVSLADDVNMDFDREGRPIGLEVLNVKSIFPESAINYFREHTLRSD